MVHFKGEKGETWWCTLIMAADQKLLDLAGSLLQMISKTQENLGEMLKIQRRKNEMNHQILQDSIGLQREVKSLLGAIDKRKEGGSMMGHFSKWTDKKWSRHEYSKEIEKVKMKQPMKWWECGGHHLCRYYPAREHKEGSSHKVPRLGDDLKAENQKRKLMEAKGLGPENSK